MIEPITEDYSDKNYIEESITTNIVMENFIEDVDRTIIDERARQIMHERYGLDNGIPLVLSDVGIIHGLSKDRIRQIEAKTLRQIRNKKSFIEKYKGEC